jgi:solute carrier family 25 protein 16
VLDNIGVEKGLAVVARDTLLEILVYEEDEENGKKEDARATTLALSESLLAIWIAQTKAALEEFDDHARFVAGQIQWILVAFGKKRPKVRGKHLGKGPVLTRRRTS